MGSMVHMTMGESSIAPPCWRCIHISTNTYAANDNTNANAIAANQANATNANAAPNVSERFPLQQYCHVHRG